MPDLITKLTRRATAEAIYGWAQDVLRTDSKCGIGRYDSGRYCVLWPGLIDGWISQGSNFIGTIDRESTVTDVENLLEDT